jgi:hypothetical protein
VLAFFAKYWPWLLLFWIAVALALGVVVGMLTRSGKGGNS